MVEALVLAAVTAGLLLALRRKPAARLLVGGVAIFVGSLMALRAVHQGIPRSRGIRHGTDLRSGESVSDRSG